MNTKTELVEQIKLVLNKLNNDYETEINNGILHLIYTRYEHALRALENNEDVNNINIIGGVRAYLDSYSDYQNPLLEEMHKPENMNKELLSK
ncbi:MULTISPECIES: hypothetical protein [Clostridia]|uniref:hypothetical protein n=1 Tax=Clostridia TaxID=186801 RepID=UPI000EA06F21|nr:MULTISPECIES: hypothetical protein [Clostridia]NBJ68734.1 hypothetical protein [Roseburia sp. 1XD42-34]RKI80594.1 hypothetical protein D7V87_03415 [Clostridium sp. 1xD42-85]